MKLVLYISVYKVILELQAKRKTPTPALYLPSYTGSNLIRYLFISQKNVCAFLKETRAQIICRSFSGATEHESFNKITYKARKKWFHLLKGKNLLLLKISLVFWTHEITI